MKIYELTFIRSKCKLTNLSYAINSPLFERFSITSTNHRKCYQSNEPIQLRWLTTVFRRKKIRDRLLEAWLALTVG